MSGPGSGSTDMRDLEALALGCAQCGLSKTRTQVVFGEGAENARVMFVGEAPGQEEDAQGRPFVGAAGKLLTALLGDIGLKRSDVYITNIVKCRPPGNRDPQPEEIRACNDYLVAQVALISPTVICTLGRYAAITLLDLPDFKITRDHGRAVRWKGLLAMPVLHPAAALHQARFMEPLRHDFAQLEQLLKNKNLL